MFAMVLENVLTPLECTELIAATEKSGYGEALHSLGDGKLVLVKEQRFSERCDIDSYSVTELIWDRIKKYIQTEKLYPGWKPLGLNERLRFLKYGKGMYAKPHYDRQTHAGLKDDKIESKLTCLLYLNEGMQGGQTTFVDFEQKNNVSVNPSIGQVLVF